MSGSRSRRPGIAARLPRALLLSAIGALAACNELPESPELDVPAEDFSLSLPSQILVRDTFEITAALKTSTGRTVRGIDLVWESSDPTVLRITEMKPPAGASSSDTLSVQLRATGTALRRGTSEITVTVRSPGFFEASTEYEVQVLERWMAVGAGPRHTCAVNVLGEALCWGEGTFGALGTGATDDSPGPVEVATDLTFEEIRAGAGYTCALDPSRLLYCWGDNFEGQLGLGHRLDQFIPRRIELGESFESFDVGISSRFTCAVRLARPGGPAVPGAQATLCWGENGSGELGCGSLEGCTPAGLTQPNTEIPVGVVHADATYVDFEVVSLGEAYGCGIEGGDVRCWGDNGFGQLGALTPDTTFGPAALPLMSDDATPFAAGGRSFSEVAVGGNSFTAAFSCGVVSGPDEVVCWGGPDGYPDQLAPPVAVDGLPSGPFHSLTAGLTHACVLVADGAAYCWGRNADGQLGAGDLDAHAGAIRVGGGLVFEALSAGGEHTCGITASGPGPGAGVLYCWGSNRWGQLGLGEPPDGKDPVDSATSPARVAEGIE